MGRDSMYKSVCDHCHQGTWYNTEQPCKRERQKHCPTCHQGLDQYEPCGGMLRVIDRSRLAPQFAGYYESGQRVRVRFGHGEELTGTIGKTSGWRPSYLLMRRSTDTGSVYTLSAADKVIAVQRGRRYVQTYFGA